MFTLKGKLSVLKFHRLPSIGGVTTCTNCTQGSFVRIGVAGSAIGKRKPLEHLILMAGHAGYSLVCAGELKFCFAVIKNNLLHRSFHGMTTLAIRQPAAMWILMAGSTGSF